MAANGNGRADIVIFAAIVGDVDCTEMRADIRADKRCGDGVGRSRGQRDLLPRKCALRA